MKVTPRTQASTDKALWQSPFKVVKGKTPLNAFSRIFAWLKGWMLNSSKPLLPCHSLGQLFYNGVFD